MVSTSGVIGQIRFTNRSVCEHAYRRASLRPQNIGAEQLEVAFDLLYALQCEWVNAGFPLWTRKYSLLPIKIGSEDVNTLPGTVEVLNAFWRIINPYRGACTLSGAGSNTTLFGGAPNADVTIASPNPTVTINFGTPTEVDSIGILPGAGSNITTAILVKTSTDGVTYATAQTMPSTTFQTGVWQYFGLDPSITTQYIQLEYAASATWTLNQLQLVLANSTDIPLGVLNMDDYYNLPNRKFQSDRPNSFFNDRQLNLPVIKIWPTPSQAAFYNGTVTALTRRYIQDPGSLTNIIEAPPRWYEAAIARLATRLLEELPDEMLGGGDSGANPTAGYLALQAKQQKFQRLEQQATKAEALAWGEERARGPIRLYPSVGCYTK